MRTFIESVRFVGYGSGILWWRGFLPVLLVLSGGFSGWAEEIVTEWRDSSDGGDWFQAENWTSGIPNNDETNVYSAVLDAWDPEFAVPVMVGVFAGRVTIDNFEFRRGALGVSNNSSFTVNGETLLGAEGELPEFGALRFLVTQSVLDLGTVPAFSGGVLSAAEFHLSDSTVQWRGADIRQIAEGAFVSVGGSGTGLRDSVTGGNALSRLSAIDGGLRIFSGSSEPGRFDVEADLSVTGGLTASNTRVILGGSLRQQNSNGVLEAGHLSLDRGTLEWTGADVRAIGPEASVGLTGPGAAFVDTTTGQSGLRNLENVEGQLFVEETTVETTGDLENSGRTDVSFNGRLIVGENLTNTGDLHLSAFASRSSIEIAGDLRNNGWIDVSGGDVESEATLEVGGSVTNSRHFAVQAYGSGVARTAIQGDLDNTGTVEVEGGFDGGSAGLTILGKMTQIEEGTLLAGRLRVSGYSADDGDGPGFIEWTNANIETIGAGAEILLAGSNAQLRDRETGVSALVGLRRVDGELTISNPGDQWEFQQDVATGEEGAIFLSSYDDSSTFVINGDLNNSGQFLVRASQDDFSETPVDVVASIHGNLLQQQAGVLTDGHLGLTSESYSSDPNVRAVIEWDNADIVSIAEGAGINLTGSDVVLRDRLTGNNALRNLREVNGNFFVSEGDFLFSQDLAVGRDGYIQLIDAMIAVPGDLTVQGYISFSGDSTMTVGGRLEPVNQQEVFESGSLAIHEGTLSVADLEIRRIGEGASITLGSDGQLINSTTGTSALSNLEAVDGSLSVGQHLSTPGNLEVGQNAYVSVFSGGRVDVGGQLSSVVDGELRHGSYDVSAYGDEHAVLAWQGARVDKIGADAWLWLGENGRIENATDGSDALVGLRQIDGTFNLSETTQEIASNVEVNGRLVLWGGSRVVLGPEGEGLLRNDGSLEVRSDAAIDGSVQLSNESVIEFADQEFYDFETDTYVNGFSSLEVDAITLGGEIRLTINGDGFSNWLPDPSDVFTLIDAESLGGTFDNLANGDRVDAETYDYMTGEYVPVGSFVLSYDYLDGDVLVSGFTPVPEPETIILLGMGLCVVLWRLRRRWV